MTTRQPESKDSPDPVETHHAHDFPLRLSGSVTRAKPDSNRNLAVRGSDPVVSALMLAEVLVRLWVGPQVLAAWAPVQGAEARARARAVAAQVRAVVAQVQGAAQRVLEPVARVLELAEQLPEVVGLARVAAEEQRLHPLGSISPARSWRLRSMPGWE